MLGSSVTPAPGSPKDPRQTPRRHPCETHELGQTPRVQPREAHGNQPTDPEASRPFFCHQDKMFVLPRQAPLTGSSRQRLGAPCGPRRLPAVLGGSRRPQAAPSSGRKSYAIPCGSWRFPAVCGPCGGSLLIPKAPGLFWLLPAIPGTRQFLAAPCGSRQLLAAPSGPRRLPANPAGSPRLPAARGSPWG